jgi:hypothetical protein
MAGRGETPAGANGRRQWPAPTYVVADAPVAWFMSGFGAREGFEAMAAR